MLGARHQAQAILAPQQLSSHSPPLRICLRNRRRLDLGSSWLVSSGSVHEKENSCIPGLSEGTLPPPEGHTSRDLVGNAGENGDGNQPSGKVKDGSGTTVAAEMLVETSLALIEIWEPILVSHVALQLFCALSLHVRGRDGFMIAILDLLCEVTVLFRLQVLSLVFELAQGGT